MICEFADVVVVPFPFVDRPISKVRPALVLSTDRFNAANGHSVMTMITTGAGSTWPGDVVIEDLTEAGLAHRSLVRWKVFTLPNGSIVRRAGALGKADQVAIRNAMRAMFG